MADLVSTAPPATLTAGDTLRWRQRCPDTPLGDGWSVRVVLTGPSTLAVDASADVTDAEACLILFAASTTTGLPAGSYRWTALASKGEGAALERRTIATGQLQVLPDPAVLVGDEGLTRDERELRAVERLIDLAQASPLAEYTVDGATGKRWSLPELYERQGVLRSRIGIARRRRAGRSPIAAIGVRFGPTS